MKKRKSILIYFILLLGGCADGTKQFIPGTYLRNDTTEFGFIEDTIIISVQNSTAKNTYLIEERWQYKRILDGRQIEPEYKQKISLALYHEDSRLLQNQSTLRNYSFNPDKGILFSGTVKFYKQK